MARFNIVALTNISNNDKVNNKGANYIEMVGLYFVH